MRFLLLKFLRRWPRPRPGMVRGALLATLILAGCGASTNSTVSGTGGTTTVTVLITSTANDQIDNYITNLKSLTLTSQTAGTAYLISSPVYTEFLQVNGTTEPLLTVAVPQGVYTSAAISIGGSSFSCLGLDPTQGTIFPAAFDYGYTPASHITISLPSPIKIAGDNAMVLLNLQAAQSAVYSNKADCPISTGAWSITPTFTLTLADNANPMFAGLKGLIENTAASGGSFAVIAAAGYQMCGSSGCGDLASDAVWQVATDANTVYQGIGGFSALKAGIPVDMDATLQPDGTLLAKRVAVYDTDPSNLSAGIGPVMGFHTGSAINEYPTEQFSPQTMAFWPLSLGNAAFNISGQFSNVQSLPFPASFTAANLVAGQNVYATTHQYELKQPVPYLPAATVTLIPQTIDGTVGAIGKAGGFRTYTVTLAPYDLFPAGAVKTNQTTVLTNPNTVVVYADSNTQMLNTNPITVGSVVRFYGLVFNDNGTLRMDCAQINDGVPE